MSKECLDYIKCSLVGFNFTYLTFAVAILGASVARRIYSDTLRYHSIQLFAVATTEGHTWHHPFLLYYYASFLPLGVSVIAALVAFLWVARLRPAYCQQGRTVGCKHLTNVVFVILIVSYTAGLVPSLVYGFRFSRKLDDPQVVSRIRDELSLAFRQKPYYVTNRSHLSPTNYQTTPFGEIVDKKQHVNKCCGIQYFEDGSAEDEIGPFFYRNGIPFPYTCCSGLVLEANVTRKSRWRLCLRKNARTFSVPCFNSTLKQVKESFAILDGAGLSALMVGVMAVILSVTFTVLKSGGTNQE